MTNKATSEPTATSSPSTVTHSTARSGRVRIIDKNGRVIKDTLHPWVPAGTAILIDESELQRQQRIAGR